MNKIIILCLSILIVTSCEVHSKILTDQERRAIKYTNVVFKEHLTKTSKFFDLNDNEISKQEFAINSNKKGFIAAKVSSDTFKIAQREYQGVIRNPQKIYEHLNEITNKEFNPNAPLVILYHPGNDGCFSSGYTDKEWTKNKFNDLEKNIQINANTKPIYLFKSNNGLSKFKGIINWEKDKNEVFEEIFFPYHCPCGSYAIMGKNGNYYINNGESDHTYLLAILNKIVDDSMK